MQEVPGLVTVPSKFSHEDTIGRLEALLSTLGVEVFSRVDHAAAASAAGLDLPPTRLLIFGNPRLGTLLMQNVRTIGIDLPLRVLVWQSECGKTFVSYDEPMWLAKRHGIGDGLDQAIDKMTAVLRGIATGVAT